MTHPKARTKRRPRSFRDNLDRIVITAKGRAMLRAHEQLTALALVELMRRDAQHHEQGRATPCAPKRAAPDAPANTNGEAVTPAAHPRTPAGKSGAAELAKEQDTD